MKRSRTTLYDSYLWSESGVGVEDDTERHECQKENVSSPADRDRLSQRAPHPAQGGAGSRGGGSIHFNGIVQPVHMLNSF